MPWIDDLPAEVADSLSDEVKTNPTLIQYKTLEDALQGHIKTKSLVGSSIRIPGPDAGNEDKNEFYQKLIDKDLGLMLKPDFSEPEQAQDFYNLFGKPTEATLYKMPEGHSLTADVESEMREIGFSSHMNQEQFQNMVTEMDTRNKQMLDNVLGKTSEDMEGLKGEWGMTFDDRTKAAKKMNEQFYPGREFDSLGAADRKSLYDISESMTGKPSPIAAAGDGQPLQMAPAEAEERVHEIMRKAHDQSNDLTEQERLALVWKATDMKKKYIPRFAEQP